MINQCSAECMWHQQKQNMTNRQADGRTDDRQSYPYVAHKQTNGDFET